MLQTGCDFPQHYTRFENERWPEEEDALQTGGAGITARIWYTLGLKVVTWGMLLIQETHKRKGQYIL